jgi:hypothetical protein
VDEAELFDRGLGEDEGIHVLEPHAAVEAVEDVGHGEPVVHHVVERGVLGLFQRETGLHAASVGGLGAEG